MRDGRTESQRRRQTGSVVGHCIQVPAAATVWAWPRALRLSSASSSALSSSWCACGVWNPWDVVPMEAAAAERRRRSGAAVAGGSAAHWLPDRTARGAVQEEMPEEMPEMPEKPGSNCCKVGGRAGRQDPPGAPWRPHSVGGRSPTRGPNTVRTTLPHPKPSFRAVLCAYS